MTYQILHRTCYQYQSQVSDSHHLCRLVPQNDTNQAAVFFQLRIVPEPDFRATHHDYFGNETTYFSLSSPHKELVIESSSTVTVHEPTPVPMKFDQPWEKVREILKTSTLPSDLKGCEFIHPSPLCPVDQQLRSYAQLSFSPGRPFLEACGDFMTRIFNDFRFDSSASTVTTPVLTTLQNRAGVCQDFAHLMISCLRSIGLAARYISGYLRTIPPPGQPRMIGADASHAWIETYLPGYGWVGYDATNNMMPGLGHIRTAMGRDYHDICPVRGTVYGGGAQKLTIGVTVTPLQNAPV